MRILLLLLPLLAACSRVHPERTTWHAYDAYRLSNGTVELVAVPSVGRIVHYSRVNGPNVFWTWPDGGKEPAKYTGFKNIGGEKVWLWPQKEWPPLSDSIPYTAAVSGDTLILTSAEVPGAPGVKIRRHIRMDPAGTGVTITNELLVAPNHAPKVALWSVAQVPPGTFKVRLLNPQQSPVVFSLDPSQTLWQPTSREGDVAVFHRTGESIKSGLESDLITATSDNQTFRIHVTASSGFFDPGTRAQLYADPDRSFTRPRTTQPYVEIEFLSPWLTPDAAPTLTTRWTIEPGV